LASNECAGNYFRYVSRYVSREVTLPASIGRAQRTFLHHEGVKIGNCWDENLWLKLAAKTEELWKN
jgi:hypothetical protein